MSCRLTPGRVAGCAPPRPLTLQRKIAARTTNCVKAVGPQYDQSKVNNFDFDEAWVLPDGRFYGCKFGEHDVVAQYVFGIPPLQAEKLGWVRIKNEPPFHLCEKKYTQAQINTIYDYYTARKAFYALGLFFQEIT